MGAISATLLALCKSGDHIVASNAVYGGSYALMHDFLPERAGITATFVDITDLGAVRNAITDKTRVVYTESMSNPTLRVADIPKLSSIAREAGIPLVVDNTFSPLILSPVDHGADIISGMSDVIAGAVCGTREFIESLMDLHEGSLMLLGPRPWTRRSPRISACASRICRSAWPRTANARWRLHNASTTLVRTSVTRDSTVIRIAACSTN
jgi:methionine-gamma-lyase